DDTEAEARDHRRRTVFGGRAIAPPLDRQHRVLARVRHHVRLPSRTCRPCRLHARVLDDVRRGDGGWCAIRDGPASILLDSDGHWLIASPVEMLDDGCCGRDRNLVLAGTTAVHDTDSKLFHDQRTNINVSSRYD